MIPLSLYIHIPWCIRKCPYCDFNSHQLTKELPEKAYINALIKDLRNDLERFEGREIQSIFIGGGTPSLIDGSAYDLLLCEIQQWLPLKKGIEITLEANPGTVEHHRFQDYRAVGINRLSLGIQSFHHQHLSKLGRIHDEKQAHLAIESAQKAGFTNINLDLMYGLPGQSLAEALEDLRLAISHQPQHLSWYQLTLEPNTVFYKQRPVLPPDDAIAAFEEQGLDLLQSKGFNRYEISAFSLPGFASAHNLNYWLFGDYLGIGAGAHGKLTTDKVYRTQKYRQPKEYLDESKHYLSKIHAVEHADLLFELMLNATRLEQAIPYTLFSERAGLGLLEVQHQLQQAEEQGLLVLGKSSWKVTPLGRRFTNDLQALFLI